MKYIALHHTAVSRERQPVQLYAVDRYHQGKWGMKSTLGWYVGYNFFCEKDGTRTNTRSVGEETIANRGHNCDIPERCDTISYCMAGDFNTELPTQAQWDDFKTFYKEMKGKYPNIEVVFHRDIQDGRTCPGHNMTKDLVGRMLDDEPEKDADDDQEKREKIAELKRQIDYIKFLLHKLFGITI